MDAYRQLDEESDTNGPLGSQVVDYLKLAIRWATRAKIALTFTRALLGPNQINEYASVVVLQVGKLVGEVGEIIAHACLQVFADVVVNRGQDAAAVLINIRQTKLPDLG